MELTDTSRPCPCCGYLTFTAEDAGHYDICDVCFWEDDPIQAEDPDFEGGANVPSLNQARASFAKYGAMERRFTGKVRKPLPGEIP